jgi:hypothetical protein
MLSIIKGTKELTIILESYIGDIFTEDLLTSESIDIGFFKPINSIYIELKSQNAENVLSLEYFDGSNYSPVNIVDRTLGLSRSGFVKWERNLENQKQSLLHGKTLYWYKLKISTNDIPALELRGLNLVFSDDNNLKETYPDVMEYVGDSSTFISYHQSARNFILTYLRNKGKTVSKYGVYKMLDHFDLHDYEEVQQAAKYKALAMIFFNESDIRDDKWYQKAKDFDALYAESIDLNFLSLDLNNDGKIDESETQRIQFIQIQRL